MNRAMRHLMMGAAAAGKPAGEFLLDLYPGARVAYSLRRLSTSYTGAAIRVRRESDDAEQDIGFTGAGDFDSAAIESFIGASTGRVRTWYDQSGNGTDLQQGTPGSQPEMLDSETLGQWVITGSGGFMLSSAIDSIPSNANGCSVFVLNGTISSNIVRFSQYNFSSNRRVFATNAFTQSRTQYEFSVQIHNSVSADRIASAGSKSGYGLLTGRWGGADTASQVSIDGGAMATASDTTPAITTQSQGVELFSIDDGGTISPGTTPECVAYPTANDGVLSDIQTNIMTYWGIE